MRITVLALLLSLALPAPGRQFLLYDPHGDGKVVEAVGDVARADHIVVLVPGVDTTLRDFDRGLGGVARRAPAGQARTLLAALHETDPGVRVAVIAWLGYDTPEGGSVEAARDLRARAGAEDLIPFVRSLPAHADVTLLGHSYGAIVAGLAAEKLDRVHTVIALGAPGLGVQSASELPGKHVWSALAPDDWMHRVPELKIGHLGHGRRPSSPGFGATALPAADVHGHDGYLVAGVSTLTAVTHVVLGGTA
jgi:pimeloyl-ACP methyl ester carboxylesterase